MAHISLLSGFKDLPVPIVPGCFIHFTIYVNIMVAPSAAGDGTSVGTEKIEKDEIPNHGPLYYPYFLHGNHIIHAD